MLPGQTHPVAGELAEVAGDTDYQGKAEGGLGEEGRNRREGGEGKEDGGRGGEGRKGGRGGGERGGKEGGGGARTAKATLYNYMH